ncbi:Flp pilus assembly protein CpaB [Arabiibacter massiliensis]|uniref:Flp pilus assembly protein CpaB n=1 Tax=Arabiibacter massiliensis TaxID=1870985 RepID=UPI0009BBA02C|nr:Flp pilus assembly protein CpaB [Arabiibacter massiliensis]
MRGVGEGGGAARGGGFAARAARGGGTGQARRPHVSGAASGASGTRAGTGASSSEDRPSPVASPQGRAAGRAKALALVAAASVAVAVVSVGYGTWAVASARAAEDAIASGMAPTVVAASAIPAGAVVAEESLSLVDVPRAFRSEGALDAGGAVVGGRATVDIPAGAQIVEGFVAGAGQGGRLAAALEAGQEAVTVSVDAETGLAGQVRPYDAVRVVAAETSGTGEALLRTVCERALVLSTGFGQDDLAAATGAITLAVSPEEADAVREAQYAGKVSFVLVALADVAAEGESHG